MNEGGKIGIAFAVIFLALVAGIVALVFRQRNIRQQNSLMQEAGFDNLTYDSTSDSLSGGQQVNVDPNDFEQINTDHLSASQGLSEGTNSNSMTPPYENVEYATVQKEKKPGQEEQSKETIKPDLSLINTGDEFDA